MDIAQIMARLEAAVKNITDTNDLGASIIAKFKFARFVRAARDATRILPEARFIPMDSHRVEIDLIGFAGEILRAGRSPQSEDHPHGQDLETQDEHYRVPSTVTNELIARELRGETSLTDHLLRRNIERGNLEDTLVDLFGEAAGRDLEAYAVFADSTLPFSSASPFVGKYALTDGWVARAGNKLFADQLPEPAAEGTGAFPENVLQAQLEALPKRFLNDRSQWRYWVPFEIFDAYQDLLRARGTQLGDQTQTGTPRLTYKGIPLVEAPVLASSAAQVTGTGRVSILGHPDNHAWGVFHDVTVERERVARHRRTDWHLTVEADADYEDRDGVVVAHLDQDEPS